MSIYRKNNFSNSIVTIYKKNIKLLVLSLYTNYLPGENKKEKDVYILIYIGKIQRICMCLPIYIGKTTIMVITIYREKQSPFPAIKEKEKRYSYIGIIQLIKI